MSMLRNIVLTLTLTGQATFAMAEDCPRDAAREQRVQTQVAQTLFDGDPVRLDVPGESANPLAVWFAGRAGMPAIVLAHGPGRNLGSPVILETAMALNALGYPALALQMPLQRKDCEGGDAYPQVFDAAVARIDAAARWLQARGETDLVLLAHWIGNVYFERTAQAPFKTWIVNGLTGNFHDIGENSPRILDVYGSQGHEMTLRWAWTRRLWLWFCEDAQQVRIDGADHEFTGKYDELARVIDQFLLAGQSENQ